MARLGIAVAVSAALASTSASAGYLNVNDHSVTEKVIPVKLKRGQQVETGRLVYKAWVTSRVQEDGEASTLRHPRDDRQCSWQVSAHMQRQYFVQSVLGPEDSTPASGVVVPLQINGQSNGLVSFFDHDPCTDYGTNIANAVAGLKSATMSTFDAKMNEDLQKFKTETAGVTVEVTQ